MRTVKSPRYTKAGLHFVVVVVVVVVLVVLVVVVGLHFFCRKCSLQTKIKEQLAMLVTTATAV